MKSKFCDTGTFEQSSGPARKATCTAVIDQSDRVESDIQYNSFSVNGVHSTTQGFIRSIPQPSKSGVLRVATGALWARAMAAI